ncbi:MAG TPA: Gfo/Idh/MocA family oxidoreductase [Spirochaetia bacterium]|nr:Gfo/Idh/MocA family oxidoreductase [Spirochaetia bacterium]
MQKKRYVLVGTGSRSYMYTTALMSTHKDAGELLALCDTNQTRMNYANELISTKFGAAPRPTYPAHEFDRMILEQKPDAVIVTSMDRTHHTYICKAMELGCDVVTEKPMTVDEEKAQQIIDTVSRTGKDLKVTFNYRYSPRNTRVKELLLSGEIGDVLSVHFEWLLDTVHGADYFRRWHRDKANNGGLLVHKSTHHFDLMNWWLASDPELVFALGGLMFYGRQNAESRGVTSFYERAQGSEAAKSDPFALHLDQDENLKRMYLDAEHEDGYHRDQSVFGYNISTEDTMGLLVRYRNHAIMTYSLNAYCPWEGYRVMFNGTKGRLEFNVVEKPYVSGAENDTNRAENRAHDEVPEMNVPMILVHHHWKKPYAVEVNEALGGHGGGDVRMLDHIFRGASDDPLGHAAGYRDGAMSILTGIAGNRSMASGLPIRIGSLVNLPEA